MSIPVEEVEITTFVPVVNGFAIPNGGIRIKHIPSGLSAECFSERSQHANKAKAFHELNEKIAEYVKQKSQPVVATGIDLTPTWRGVLPLLIAALENGTEAGRRLARQELARMAQAADNWNEQARSQTP